MKLRAPFRQINNFLNIISQAFFATVVVIAIWLVDKILEDKLTPLTYRQMWRMMYDTK